MKRMILLFAVLALSGLIGCKKENNYFSESSASSGGGSGGAVDDTTGFRIRLKAKEGVDAFMHKFGDISEECEIPISSKSTPTSIECMINMMEYDVWYYGFEFEINVPKDFCKFLDETPNHFYKSRPGRGPIVASIATTDGVITACTVDGVAGTVTGNTCVGAEATFSSSGSLISCAYDYTRADATTGLSGPNCCVGSGAVTLAATTTGGTPPTVTTTQTVLYGGKISACMESAHEYIDQWPINQLTSRAMNAFTELGAGGLSRTRKIPSASTLGSAGKRLLTSNIHINANFYDWDAYAADPATWITSRSIPRAVATSQDRGPSNNDAGTSISTAFPGDGSYYFACRNAAGETVHSIRMFLNAWNTVENYTTFKTDGDETATTPNVYGTAGVNCSAVNGTGTCNNFWGFDDLIEDYGAGVKTAHVYPEYY